MNTINPNQTTSPNATNGRGIKKSTPVATASAPLASQVPSKRKAPSQAIIAQKAYELWFVHGQKPGCDQQYWFEAEQLLQHV